MRRVTFGSNYNGYPLSNTSKNGEGFYEEVLCPLQSLMESMSQRHACIFFSRFDFRYPANSAVEYPNDNTLFSGFIDSLMHHCERRKYDPEYLWVRENSKNNQIHYHLVLLLNGDYIQNAYGILQKATELWQRRLNIKDGRGLVHLCPTGENDDYGGVKIKRNHPNFQQVFQNCYQRASYLAKCYSKSGSPAYVNGFRCSRLS